MPAYNAEKYVQIAIESILSQTFKDFELIIIDDGSTDGTRKKLQEYKHHKKIRLLRNTSNKGISETLNKGIKEAKANIIARMDSDDVCSVSRLEKEFQYLKKNPHKDLVYTDLFYINEKGRKIGKREYEPKKIASQIHIESPIAHATVMFRKNMLKKTGLYQSQFDGAEDYDLWIRAHLANIQFGHIPEQLYGYRMQQESTKFRSITKQIQKVVKVKQHAINSYGWKMSFAGKLRLVIEIILSHLPNWLSLFIYRIAYIKRD